MKKPAPKKAPPAQPPTSLPPEHGINLGHSGGCCNVQEISRDSDAVKAVKDVEHCARNIEDGVRRINRIKEELADAEHSLMVARLNHTEARLELERQTQVPKMV